MIANIDEIGNEIPPGTMDTETVVPENEISTEVDAETETVGKVEVEAVGGSSHDNQQAFQIIMNNVHKYTNTKELEAFLRSPSIDIKYKKMKKVPEKNFAFVYFESKWSYLD